MIPNCPLFGGYTFRDSLFCFMVLYLLLQPLDKEQSWQWVVEHRLPLFLRSDLYSEYKISKLLTTPALDMPTMSAWRTGIIPSQANHQLLQLTSLRVNDMEDTSALNLPDIGTRTNANNMKNTTSAVGLNNNLSVAVSKFDAVLEIKPVGKKVKWQRSWSVDQELAVTPSSPVARSHGSATSTSVGGGKVESVKYLATKSGMGAFWKFLKGKVGERNLLFWLDAERITYFDNDQDQKRYVSRYAIGHFQQESQSLLLSIAVNHSSL